MSTLFIGLISGTSMDGIDAVLVDFAAGTPATLAARTFPYPDHLRTALDEVRRDPDAYPAARLARLDAEVGGAFAEAVNALLADAGIDPVRVRAVGSHGQTVLHRPDDDFPHTLQIGDPARIAVETGIDTIADFRRADLAAGGQGAPLAPLIHRALLADSNENRIAVNLGGIANVTVLPTEGGAAEGGAAEGGVSGFDTGPANCFLDDWYRAHHREQNGMIARFDANGQWASTGSVDETWLAELMQEPYLHRKPPKSTGIEYFSPAWLRERLPGDAGDRPADIQATLAEYAAASLAGSIEQFVPFTPDRVVLCGGGVHNPDLVGRIARRLAGIPVESTAARGIDPDYIEATLIAWLAREHLAGRPVDTPPITGARCPVRLGALWPAPQ
ncbi:MAG: anhydro-N-acetylmuramic acid kinase [Wenzhouxiangellaceae bacterium]|nr:anhydro-N-acetylmuramic acid kinase [Wenzhouxiangellaceae bacterium]